ncbi:hypothetical protein M422DRAFT_245344 [Sphaerobolus stellatus SS14]|nr:hypothetical protein M422DRAFT_245344 [Sphaerobolus stellatus SS14]
MPSDTVKDIRAHACAFCGKSFSRKDYNAVHEKKCGAQYNRIYQRLPAQTQQIAWNQNLTNF